MKHLFVYISLHSFCFLYIEQLFLSWKIIKEEEENEKPYKWGKTLPKVL